MKASRVLLDTNVLLDYVLDRGVASIHAERIFEKCVRGEIECHIAAHTIVNMFYILRKVYSVSERKTILSSLSALCYVEPVDDDMIQKALTGNHKDIEDHLQILCAEEIGAKCIITRDIRGFEDSSVRILSPKAFLEQGI